MGINKLFVCCIICVSLCISGCQDKTERLLGAWKTSATNPLHGHNDVFVFEKNQFFENLLAPQTANYETKDGKIFVHIDTATIEVTFVDDNTIMVSVPLGQIKCVRIDNTEAESMKNERRKPTVKPKTNSTDWRAF